MASGPISSWQIIGDKMEVMTHLIFLGFKITVDGDCSHEIKRHVLLGRKALTNPDSVLKNRDITLPAKVHIYQEEEVEVKSLSCVRLFVTPWTVAY